MRLDESSGEGSAHEAGGSQDAYGQHAGSGVVVKTVMVGVARRAFWLRRLRVR
jgi:hypothetical protein